MYIYLDHLSYGNIYSLLLEKLQANFHKMLISGFTFIIGLAILFTLCIFKYFNIGMRSGIACSLLLVIGSICTFIDYEYVTLLIPFPKIINRIDILSQLFVCEFLMIYFRGFLHHPLYVKWIDRLLGFWSVIIIGFCILMMQENTNIIQYYDKLPYVVVPMLLLGLYFLWEEYKELQDKNIRRLLISGSCLVCCAIAEVVHYEVSGNYWIFVFQGGLLLFTLAQFIGLLEDTRRRLEQAERVKEMESKLVEGQIDILCTQIKPHFIFNVLNTISSLCLTNPTKADEVVMYLSKYLRTNINALEHRDKVSFAEELDNIECYVAIERIRFGDRIKFIKDISVENFQVPALSIEPLVENSIKHGLSRKKEGGTVKLSTRAEADTIVITVEDDGLGFDLAQVSVDKDSIGMDNVRRRLSYSMQAQMDITSSFSNGTKIVIRLPKK